jgi:hypothetical protein
MKLTKLLILLLLLSLKGFSQQNTIYALNPWTNSGSVDVIAKYNFNSTTNVITIDNSYVSPQNSDINNAYYGIEQNPINGKIYVLKNEARAYGIVPRKLYEFDLNSGITNNIGDIVSNTTNYQVSIITFDNSGNLYALFNYSGPSYDLQLQKINYSNPTPSSSLPATDIVLSPSIPSGGNLGMTYDFDNDRILIGVGRNIYTINKITGSTSLLLTTRETYQAMQYVGNNKLVVSNTGVANIFLVDLISEGITDLANPIHYRLSRYRYVCNGVRIYAL